MPPTIENVKITLAFACTAAGLLAACSATGQNSTDSSSASQPSGTVAIVDGEPILEKDLGIKGELLQLEQQAHRLRMQAVEEAIADRLIEKEAGKRGMSPDELFEQEVASKVADPAPIEVEAFYEQQKQRIRRPLEEVRDKVTEVLKSVRAQEAKRDFVAKLREGSDVKVLLDPPRLPVDLSSAPLQGPEDALVTIVEFSDFLCPFCKRVQPTLAQVQAKYGDQVRWSFKDLPLLSIHPQAMKAAEAARCAGDQGKFWDYRAELFGAPRITDDLHREAAGKLGLDVEEFESCLASDKHRAAVQADLEEAESLGLSGTPAFLINGVLISGAQPFEAFAEIIDREIAKAAER